MMQQPELEKFAAICQRHGLSADQFRVGDDDDCEGIIGHGTSNREIAVTYLSSAIRRSYLRDVLSDWLEIFEKDVIEGRFLGGHAYDW